MIDGYRGTYWSIGQKGIGGDPKQKGWEADRIYGPERWIEVRFNKSCAIGRAVVISANLEYEFQLPQNNGWRTIAPKESVKSGEYVHSQETDVRTFGFDPINTDRVRLSIPKKRDWKSPPEMIFEIEVYQAAGN